MIDIEKVGDVAHEAALKTRTMDVGLIRQTIATAATKEVLRQLIDDVDWPVKKDGEHASTHADVWRIRLDAKAMLKQIAEGLE